MHEKTPVEPSQDPDINIPNPNNDNIRLYSAVQEGHSEEVQILLEKGADPNFKNIGGFSLLQIAAILGHTNIMNMLLKKGADISVQDKNGLTLLHLASGYGQVGVVERLLEKDTTIDVDAKDNNECTALYMAITHDQLQVIKILLAHGANALAQNKEGITPLHQAAEKNNPEVIQIFMENAKNIQTRHKNGSTFLHIAAMYGGIETMQILLAQKDVMINVRDDFDHTPSHIAAGYGNSAILRLFIEKGAIVDATLLHMVAARGLNEIIPLLVERGLNINVQNLDKETTLHVAVRYNCIESIETLLACGADIHAKNNRGETPIDLASSAILEKLIAKKFFSLFDPAIQGDKTPHDKLLDAFKISNKLKGYQWSLIEITNNKGKKQNSSIEQKYNIKISYYFNDYKSTLTFRDLLKKTGLFSTGNNNEVIISYHPEVLLDDKKLMELVEKINAISGEEKRIAEQMASNTRIKVEQEKKKKEEPENRSENPENTTHIKQKRVLTTLKVRRTPAAQCPKKQTIGIEHNAKNKVISSKSSGHKKKGPMSKPITPETESNNRVLIQKKIMPTPPKTTPTARTASSNHQNSTDITQTRLIRESNNTPVVWGKEQLTQTKNRETPKQDSPKSQKENVLKTDSYLTGLLYQYRTNPNNRQSIIRAIYYSVIHELLSEMTIETEPMRQLRNVLVNYPWMAPDWDKGEKLILLLKLADILCYKSADIRQKQISEIKVTMVPPIQVEKTQVLITLMTTELAHLQAAFALSNSERKSYNFFHTVHPYLNDSCLASLAILVECYNELCQQPDFDINHILEITHNHSQEQVKDLLERCRWVMDNRTPPINEDTPDMFKSGRFYLLLLSLSQLKPFALPEQPDHSLHKSGSKILDTHATSRFTFAQDSKREAAIAKSLVEPVLTTASTRMTVPF